MSTLSAAAMISTPSGPRVLLTDNGSLEAASTMQLRALAAALAERLGLTVEPVSLAHSDKIPAEALGGRPAELFQPALRRGLAEGVSEFVVVPNFIGPSLAITRWLPGMVAEQQALTPQLRVAVAGTLYQPGDDRLAEILTDHVRAQLGTWGTSEALLRPRVAIVDHGSPARAVAEVRDAIAAQVRARLGEAVRDVAASSMERRPGDDYAFNEPLLETLLRREGWSDEPLVIGMLFIGPGRHAGPGGDVAEIVRAARTETLAEVRTTRLLGQHPRLVEILADRARAAMR